MNKRNYQKELDKLIEKNQKKGETPRLFLHACCAPCSSYVMEYLSQYFEITIFFYNPNITPEEEYAHRVAEIRRLIGEMEFSHPVTLVEGRYDTKEFYEMARGLEEIPEGGERCFKCYRLRMEETARLAKTGGYDYFTTTLSISPLKNVQKINEIGEELAEIYEVPHLTSDFKKRMDTSVLLSCPMSMICTGRIIVAVFFRKKKHRKETEKEPWKIPGIKKKQYSFLKETGRENNTSRPVFK